MKKNMLKILISITCAIIVGACVFNFYGAQEKKVTKKLEVPVLTADEKTYIDGMLQDIAKQKAENPETAQTPYGYLENQRYISPLTDKQFYQLAQYLLATGQAGDINKADKCCPPIFHAFSEPRLLELLLQSGADVNIKDEYGNSPLLRALEDNQSQTVQLLIKYGANINEQTPAGVFLLCETAISDQSEMAKILIQAGATCDEEEHQKWLSSLGYKHTGTLKKAVDITKLSTQRPEIEFALLSKDLKSIEQEIQTDGSGDTTLIRAIQKNNLPLINYLIHNQPALLTTPNKKGLLPLQIALRKKNRNAALLIIKQADKNVLNEQQKDEYGYTPLLQAVYANIPDLVEALVANGANIEGTDKYNFTPLMSAYSPEMIEKLLALGAKISPTQTSSVLNTSITTPDKLAILLKHTTLQQLNELQEPQGLRRTTPLINAILSPSVGSEVIEMLLKAGARLDVPDSSGNFPLHRAISHPEKLKLLLKYATPQEINQLTAHTDKNESNYTPFFNAISASSPEAAKMLLDAGADLTVKSSLGRLPLHQLLDMLSWNKDRVENTNKRLEILQIMLNSKQMSSAILQEQEEIDKRYPLCLAAAHNLKEAALLLINAGAKCDDPQFQAFLEPLIKQVEAEKAKGKEAAKYLPLPKELVDLTGGFLALPEEESAEQKEETAKTTK